MNFIKRLFLYAVFALSLNHLFADKQIGLVPSSVKNESDIFQVGVLENNTPVLVVKEEREGFVSTITEYFVIYGKEKIGPFDYVGYTTFSPDSKTLSFTAKIDGKWYEKVFFNSQTYTGSICGNKVVYIKDGKIMLKD